MPKPGRMDLLRLNFFIILYQWRKGIAVVLMSLLVIVGFFFMLHISQFDEFPTTKRDYNDVKSTSMNKLRALPLKLSPSSSTPNHPRRSFSFKYLINEPHFCIERTPLFIVTVASAPANAERRMAIRTSWGNTETYNATRGLVVFLIGKVSSIRLQKQLHEESMSFRDIVQGDFVDSYRNLTLKSLMGLKWFSSYCPKVKFLMKTDDDVFVNTLALSNFLLRRQSKRRWIVGCVKTHAGLPRKMRRNKAVPVLSLPYSHPVFLAGAGYVISGDLPEALYEKAQTMTLFPVEDAFITGHCAKALGVIPEHSARFSCGEVVGDYCELSQRITGHKISAGKQGKVWKIVTDPHACNHASGELKIKLKG